MTKMPFCMILCKNLKDWSSNVCSWSTVENMVNSEVLENSRRFERVFLDPKWGYDSCPYLSFFVWRVKRRSLWLDTTKILKYRHCTDFGRKNMFVNVTYAMQHSCYECKTNWELSLTKYVVSIAGLVDINRIANNRVCRIHCGTGWH